MRGFWLLVLAVLAAGRGGCVTIQPPYQNYIHSLSFDNRSEMALRLTVNFADTQEDFKYAIPARQPKVIMETNTRLGFTTIRPIVHFKLVTKSAVLDDNKLTGIEARKYVIFPNGKISRTY